VNPEELCDRFLDYASSIMKLEKSSANSYSSKHIYNQLFRSSISCGANYSEACSAESRADFIHKMQLVLKELRESLFWLKLSYRSQMNKSETIKPLIIETDELISVIVKSIKTAKSK